MKFNNISFLTTLLFIQCLATLCVAQDFDFYYFVQQWAPAYCDSRTGCCYPTTGKPAEDFGIHGLWPNYDDGKYPSSCDTSNSFDESKIEDLISEMEREWPTLACPSADGLKFWGHEWSKHGTCAETFLDEHSYFQSALELKKRSNLLQLLENAGITPENRNYYTLQELKEAISGGLGHEPYIECNVDPSGNHQLYQVYICVDKSASDFIDCPVFPHGRGCGSKIEFPSFSSGESISNDEL